MISATAAATVMIDGAMLHAIVEQAENAYPNECCGLLVGRQETPPLWRITALHPSPNLATQPRKRFEVDPALRLSLQKQTRAGPDQVIGLYHSHPDSPAQPSEADLAMAWEPALLWLITAVADGQAIHTTAHRLIKEGRQFAQLYLVTSDWKPYARRTPITGEGLP